MNTKEIRTLTNTVYDYARQNSLPQAKETYITLLEKAKDSPSIAKLVFNDSLLIRKDTFFKEARETAKITGSTLSIQDAVKKNTEAMQGIKKLQNDKDILPLRKSLEKSITALYKKTKSVREKAELTQNDTVSLNTLRESRKKYNWLRKLF